MFWPGQIEFPPLVVITAGGVAMVLTVTVTVEEVPEQPEASKAVTA
jgi:hypothetical protein